MRRHAEQLGLDLAGTSVGEAGTPEAPGSTPPAPPLPDAEARRRIAEELDVNLLVEAGAGSGKTTALVSRMVALVREGAAEVTEIAAVTFTRKAAGELRERFQEALEQEYSRGDLGLEGKHRLERALGELDRAFMGTIHAFCARLLRERPIEAGIDPAFTETTAAEANRLAGRFWSLHLESLAAVGDPSLGELEDVGLAPSDVRGLYETLRGNLDVEYPLDRAPAPPARDVRGLRVQFDALLDDAAALIPPEEPPNEWDDLQRRLRSILYTRRYRAWADDRVFLDAVAEMCTRKAWKATKASWPQEAPAKVAVTSLVNAMNTFVAEGGAARALLEQWWAHRYPIAVGFALEAARALERHRLATGTLDFQDLLTLAARVLRESPAARRGLGRRWKRLLVDEFQDTDPIQAEVLFLLASDPDTDQGDWAAATPRPGALFVVGDPKQSIYRFRRADISLYAQVRTRFASMGGVVPLTSNFRSAEPIAALVNEVFAPPTGFPAEGDAVQAAFAPLLPVPSRPPAPETAPPTEGVFHYEVRADRKANEAVAAWDAAALADWIAGRVGEEGDRKAGDFLILTLRKAPLETYARALEARNLPVQVSGSGVGVEEEVAELRLLLEALADPGNPAKTLAVLVGLFGGLDAEQLLVHREAGRGFDFRYASPGVPDDSVEAALARMRSWWELARTEPADVVVGRMAAELGLLPHAAAGDLGGVRAGALAFVLDAVRGAGGGGDTSFAGALEALETALEDEEVEAPLEPGRADTIRLMNLHKAKGLEARVVVLAAPFGEREDAPVEHRIERSADGRARGWVLVQKKERWSTRVLARPLGWAAKEAEERAFRLAESFRLLYVASTRAKEELIVARAAEKTGGSLWSRLHPWLDAHGTRLDLVPKAPPPRERLEATAEALQRACRAAAQLRFRAADPTFRFESVTSAVEHPDAVGPEATFLSLDPGDGPGGHAWGSAVHGVLEAAARRASAEHLRSVGRALLLELDRPARGGEPTELDALVETAQSVLSSSLWERSRAAGDAHAEVPFTLLRLGSEPPAYVEGVVDLAFRETDGWVLVDYKTDRGDDPGFPLRHVAYREQLRLYADAWQEITGEPVKERLLWFVRGRRVEVVPPG